MKRLFLVLALLLIPTMVFAAQRVVLENGSGNEVGQSLKPHTIAAHLVDGQVKATAGTLYQVTLTSGTAGAGASIYNNTSATGTPVLEVEVGVANSTQTIDIPGGASFTTGIYVDVNTSFGASDAITFIYD